MISIVMRNDQRQIILAGTALILGAATAHALLSQSSLEECIRLLIRQTARISVVLFCAAFTASSAHKLFRNSVTKWNLRNRRWIGLSFALSHTVHLLAILALKRIASDFEFESAVLIFGGMAYVFIAAMTATSFDGAVKTMGARRWKLLHKSGMYVLWAVFAVSYLPRAAESPPYIVPAALVVFALVLRIAAYANTRTS